jgi:hypothetical protein
MTKKVIRRIGSLVQPVLPNEVRQPYDGDPRRGTEGAAEMQLYADAGGPLFLPNPQHKGTT